MSTSHVLTDKLPPPSFEKGANGKNFMIIACSYSTAFEFHCHTLNRAIGIRGYPRPFLGACKKNFTCFTCRWSDSKFHKHVNLSLQCKSGSELKRLTYRYDQSMIGFTLMKGGQPAELGTNSSWPTWIVHSIENKGRHDRSLQCKCF